jgi:hypothetical protein
MSQRSVSKSKRAGWRAPLSRPIQVKSGPKLETLTALDANLVGIGGIKEPRKVLVIVTTDLRDQNTQLSRMVCTWPAKGKQVCREFDTGKLVTDDTGQ